MAYIWGSNQKGKIVHGGKIAELHTRTYIFKVTPTGGIQTNRGTGKRTVYTVGSDGIMRPTKTLPPLKPRLTR